MIDPHKAIEWMREEYPDTKYMSDNIVYSMAKDRFPQYEYPESPFLPSYEKENKIPHQDKDINEHKTSPKEVNSLWESLDLAELASIKEFIASVPGLSYIAFSLFTIPRSNS